MTENEEHLYAELSSTGSGAWGRLQRDVTSQLSVEVHLPTGAATLPMPAVRGLATDADVAVRRAAYEAEMVAWPKVEVSVAAAMNAIKGEANTVNRRRHWDAPLDASLFANSVSRATFDAMQAAVRASLPDFRAWMKVKARVARRRPVDADPGDRCRARLVGPRRSAPGRPRGHDVGRGHRRRQVGVRRVQPGARRPRRPGTRRALDRRAARRRQVGRGILHAVRRRPLARAAELVRARPSRRRRPPTNWATPITTRRWSIGRRCSDGSRWRSPRPPASSARRWWSRPASPDSRATIAWRCSTSTCRARTRSWSTSTRGSCSRPRSTPDASGAR